MAQNVDGVHLTVGNFDACRIGFPIDRATHLQTCGRGGGGDQLNDGLETDERFSTPVLRDEREQAMLDLVPLAGSGRQVTDRDGKAELVGQGLQLYSVVLSIR